MHGTKLIHLDLIGRYIYDFISLLVMKVSFYNLLQQENQKGTYLDHDTAAADHLAGLALTVNFAQTNPFAELFVVINL